MLTNELQAWFTSKGGKLHEAVEVAYSTLDGYYLCAKDDIAPSSLIVLCPRSTTISIHDIEEVAWPEAFKLRFLDSSPEVLVRFLLIHEYSLGRSSKWWPYLTTLPVPNDQAGEHNLQTPLYFNEEDRLWLKGTNIEAAVLQREHEWQQEFNEGMAFLKDNEGAASYNWSLYKWAASILTSRCFPQEPTPGHVYHPPLMKEGSKNGSSPVLCPVLDAANHDPHVRVTWLIEDGGYILITEDEVASGAQIFNNYGPKGNEELLMGYGFTLSENDFDIFALSLSIPDSSQAYLVKELIRTVPDSSRRQSDLEMHACWTFYLSLRGDAPTELLLALGLMVANDRELMVVRSTQSVAHPTLNRMRIQAQFQLRKALLQRRHRICSYARTYPQVPTNDRQAHALRYRNSQREILTTHMIGLSQRIHFSVHHGQVMSLQDIFRWPPASIRVPLGNLLRDTIGTRKAAKLKKKGYLDAVFALFVCILGLKHADGPDPIESDSDPDSDDSGASGDSPKLHYLNNWYGFLCSAYCPPPWSASSNTVTDDSCKASNCFCASSTRTERKADGPHLTPSVSEEDAARDEQTAGTAHSIVQRAVLLNQTDPVFADARFTKDYIRWALGIWRAEAVVVPTSILDLVIDGDHDEKQFEVVSTEENVKEDGEEYEEPALFLEVEEEIGINSSLVDEVNISRKKLKVT